MGEERKTIRRENRFPARPEMCYHRRTNLQIGEGMKPSEVLPR